MVRDQSKKSSSKHRALQSFSTAAGRMRVVFMESVQPQSKGSAARDASTNGHGTHGLSGYP